MIRNDCTLHSLKDIASCYCHALYKLYAIPKEEVELCVEVLKLMTRSGPTVQLSRGGGGGKGGGGGGGGERGVSVRDYLRIV